MSPRYVPPGDTQNMLIEFVLQVTNWKIEYLCIGQSLAIGENGIGTAVKWSLMPMQCRVQLAMPDTNKFERKSICTSYLSRDSISSVILSVHQRINMPPAFRDNEKLIFQLKIYRLCFPFELPRFCSVALFGLEVQRQFLSGMAGLFGNCLFLNPDSHNHRYRRYTNWWHTPP